MIGSKANFATFVPERLKVAREARGLTLKELAEMIGDISHQQISKYENGKATPSGNIMNRLIEILDFPLTYFLKPVLEAPKGVVFFRSRAAATVRSKKVHSHRLNWLIDIHKELEKLLDFPKVNVPKFNESDIYTPLDMEEIDEIALQVRKHWGLGIGPISNVLLLVEKQGVIVARSSFEDQKIDACSTWIPGDRPYILLGDEKTAVRSRFDIAHELGHLVLHSNLNHSEFNNSKNYKQIEKEANRFAAAFLLPEPSFGNEILSSSLDHFLYLKNRWKVSIASMTYRAQELNILTEHQYRYIRRLMARNKWTTFEPLDEKIPFERPVALKQAIELLLKHNVKSKSEIIWELAYTREQIEAITNLEPGTLIEESETSSPSNVIPFKLKG